MGPLRFEWGFPSCADDAADRTLVGRVRATLKAAADPDKAGPMQALLTHAIDANPPDPDVFLRKQWAQGQALELKV